MSEFLQVSGCVAASLAVSAAMLAADRRLRASALLAALAIAGGLVLGQGWEQLSSIRDKPAILAAATVLAAVAVVALALAIRRWPPAMPLLLIAALPFRVPIQVGGDNANLLVPLYAVITACAVAYAIDAFARGGAVDRAPPRPLAFALSAATVLYATQASYSLDVGFATRNVGFFLIPFAAMFVLLSELEWTPRLLGLCLAVALGESVLFAAVAAVQHHIEHIFWNPALRRSNDFHYYFRVNSLFWDPNIYGRYLAIPSVLVVSLILWVREPRRVAMLAATLLALLVGLVLAFSQTSFIAVLCGVTVVFALGLSLRWTAIAAPLAAAAVFVAVFVIGGTSVSENSAKEISSGRTTLIHGGLELAKSEPVIGHGSASFSEASAEQEDITTRKTTVSHNEPVTVAAEQGGIGVVAYLAVLAAAAWTLLAGMRSIAPGLGAPAEAIGDPLAGGEGAAALARIAVLAALVSLLAHTIGYGGYLTDPLTWALLAIGGALASAGRPMRPSSATGIGRGAGRRSAAERPGGR
jgi:O-Antigen ligase